MPPVRRIGPAAAADPVHGDIERPSGRSATKRSARNDLLFAVRPTQTCSHRRKCRLRCRGQCVAGGWQVDDTRHSGFIVAAGGMNHEYRRVGQQSPLVIGTGWALPVNAPGGADDRYTLAEAGLGLVSGNSTGVGSLGPETPRGAARELLPARLRAGEPRRPALLPRGGAPLPGYRANPDASCASTASEAWKRDAGPQPRRGDGGRWSWRARDRPAPSSAAARSFRCPSGRAHWLSDLAFREILKTWDSHRCPPLPQPVPAAGRPLLSGTGPLANLLRYRRNPGRVRFVPAQRRTGCGRTAHDLEGPLAASGSSSTSRTSP